MQLVLHVTIYVSHVSAWGISFSFFFFLQVYGYEIIVHFVTTWSIFIEVHRLFCTYDRCSFISLFVIYVNPVTISSVLLMQIGGGFEQRLITVGTMS